MLERSEKFLGDSITSLCKTLCSRWRHHSHCETSKCFFVANAASGWWCCWWALHVRRSFPREYNEVDHNFIFCWISVHVPTHLSPLQHRSAPRINPRSTQGSAPCRDGALSRNGQRALCLSLDQLGSKARVMIVVNVGSEKKEKELIFPYSVEWPSAFPHFDG